MDHDESRHVSVGYLRWVGGSWEVRGGSWWVMLGQKESWQVIEDDDRSRWVRMEHGRSCVDHGRS